MANPHRALFLQGLMTVLPIYGAVVPFAMAFGALTAQQGLSPLDAALMGGLVYAGASQMVAIDLFGLQVPAWSIVLAVFAVNFRHILYSAALTPVIKRENGLTKLIVFFFLVDPAFVETERRAEQGQPFSLTWYIGLVVPLYCVWVLCCALGAVFGHWITNPQALGLDFLLPLYFLAMVMGFRQRARWGLVVSVSAAVSILVYFAPVLGLGLALVGPPWNVTLGALAGIAVAALMPPSGPPTPIVDEAKKQIVGAMGVTAENQR